MQLHSPQRHEQRLRDLLITDAAGGQLGDPALAGGKRVCTGACSPSGSAAGGAQLFDSPVGERCGPTSVCKVKASPQDRSRADGLSGAPQGRAEVDARLRAPEQGR